METETPDYVKVFRDDIEKHKEAFSEVEHVDYLARLQEFEHYELVRLATWCEMMSEPSWSAIAKGDYVHQEVYYSYEEVAGMYADNLEDPWKYFPGCLNRDEVHEELIEKAIEGEWFVDGGAISVNHEPHTLDSVVELKEYLETLTDQQITSEFDYAVYGWENYIDEDVIEDHVRRSSGYNVIPAYEELEVLGHTWIYPIT